MALPGSLKSMKPKLVLSPAQTALAKTPSVYQRCINYNPTWQYFKDSAQAALRSKTCKRVYGQRNFDVEPVFGYLKNVFGMRWAVLRGQAKVEIMLMTMNLSKYWHRKWAQRATGTINRNSVETKSRQITKKSGLSVLIY